MKIAEKLIRGVLFIENVLEISALYIILTFKKEGEEKRGKKIQH